MVRVLSLLIMLNISETLTCSYCKIIDFRPTPVVANNAAKIYKILVEDELAPSNPPPKVEIWQAYVENPLKRMTEH